MLTSEDRRPHEKRRCCGLAALESQPLYSYKQVDVYTHLGTFRNDDSRGTLPQVTTCNKFENPKLYRAGYPNQMKFCTEG